MTVKQRFSDVSSNSENFWKKSLKVTRQWSEVTRPLDDCQTTFFDVSSNSENFWKKSLKVTRQWSEVTRPSDDCQTTFFDVSSNSEIFWKKSLKVTRQWSEVTRPLDDCQTTFFDVSSNSEIFLKKVTEGHATVVGGHATVGRLSNNVFCTFQAIWKFLKKVTERSRDSGRRSRDRRPTVKQRFLDVSSNLKIFWKKSLNGHATVVGGHATVGRLSNNVFWTFQAIWKFFEKSHWTVTRQWSEVTRPSADCQTTFFGRFKQFEIFLKKVTERSRDSGRRSRDRRPTVKQRFLYVSSNLNIFWKKSLNGHATVVGGHATVGRRQTTFFVRFKQFEIFFKKVTERSRDSGRRSRDRRPTVKQRFLDVSSNLKFFWKKSLNGHATVVGGHATVGRLSNNVFWTFQAIWKFFEKSHWTVTRQWSEVTRPSADCQTTFFGRFKQFEIFLKKVTERSRDSGRRSRDRRPTVEQRFLDVSSNLKFFWKKSLNGHATVVNIRKGIILKKVTRPSADCQTTFFGRFKQFEIFLKKVTEWSRDSGRRSRDRRPTVKQRFLYVSSNLKVFWKKSLNGHATVVGGHATVGRLSNNVFWTFQAIWNFFEKSHWTVTRQWSEVTRPSADCQTTFFRRFKQFENFWKKSLNGHATVVGGHATVCRLSNNVF